MMTSFCAFERYSFDGNNAFLLVLALNRDTIQISSLLIGPSPNHVTIISPTHQSLIALVRPTFHPFLGRWAAGYPISYGSNTCTKLFHFIATLFPSQPPKPLPLTLPPRAPSFKFFTHSPSFHHLPLQSHTLSLSLSPPNHDRQLGPTHSPSHSPQTSPRQLSQAPLTTLSQTSPLCANNHCHNPLPYLLLL